MKSRRSLLLVLLPAVVGVVAALLLSTSWVPDPRLNIQLSGDVAGLVLSAGLLFSAILVLALLRTWRREAQCRRRIEAARAAVSRGRRKFLQRLDHELKNPLMAITGGLANINPESLPPDEQEFLSIVKAQVQHLGQLVKDLRKVANLEAYPMERVEVDMAAVLRDTVELARDGFHGRPPVGEGHPLTLNLRETPWPLPAVLGDRDLLLQVVYNLIDNACKFSPPGTPVDIWASQDGSGVRIEVADEGQGIPMEDLPHMGEELYRGRTSRSVPGSGLGLAMVRIIVERHGGSFAVDSQVGEGTVVTIRLPAAGGRPAAARAQEG